MISRRCRAAILGLLSAVALSSCQPIIESQTAEVPQIVQGILSDPKTFNYALNQESPSIFSLTYEGLVTENPNTGEIEPALAKSWEISEDKTSIIFTLRDGLQWSDGTPLTVDDVLFSYNDIYLNEEIPTDARDVLRVGEDRLLPTVEKVDETRVKFTVPEPFAPFLGTTALPILPAHVLRESVETKDSEGQPRFLTKWGVDTPPEEIIGNGPFRLAGYRTGQRVIYERNPYYWKFQEGKTAYTDREGKPIERIIWQVVESTDTSLLQFRSGGLDSISVSPEYFSLLKREEDKSDFSIYNGGPAYGTTFMAFNLNKGSRNGKPLIDPVKSRWFNDVNFRKAVAYGIDYQTMINNIYRGLGEAQTSPISRQSPYYWEGVSGYSYNPEKAKELLLEAGFQYNEEGQLLDAEGNRVRFTLLTNAGNKQREAIGAQIKQDLSKIGIQVDFNPIAFGVLVDKLSNSLDWEAHIIGFTGGNEPNDGANLWSTEGGLHFINQKPQPGQPPIEGREIAPWEQEISDLYVQAAGELDPEKRKALYAETQRISQEYVPMIFLVNPLSLAAVRDRVEGIEYSALGGAFWNIDRLTVTP